MFLNKIIFFQCPISDKIKIILQTDINSWQKVSTVKNTHVQIITNTGYEVGKSTIIYHWHLSVLWDHRFAPIVHLLLWLWRPTLEWQPMPHFEKMKAIAGLLARHIVFWQRFFLLCFYLLCFFILWQPHFYSASRGISVCGRHLPNICVYNK